MQRNAVVHFLILKPKIDMRHLRLGEGFFFFFLYILPFLSQIMEVNLLAHITSREWVIGNPSHKLEGRSPPYCMLTKSDYPDSAPIHKKHNTSTPKPLTNCWKLSVFSKNSLPIKVAFLERHKHPEIFKLPLFFFFVHILGHTGQKEKRYLLTLLEFILYV